MGFELAPERKDASYFFLFPDEGAASVGLGRPAVASNVGFASNAYGLAIDSVPSVSGLRKTMLFIEKDVVQDRLSRLVESAINAEIIFEPLAEQHAGRLPSMVSYLRFLSSGDFGRLIDHTPIASRQMANALVDLLLETWPHNFSHMLRRPASSVAPRHVKRAIDVIHESPCAELTVEQLADACGVSIRALQYGFRNFLGISIGQYQRQVRLEGARRSMIDDPALTVAEVAGLWRFSNIHRFSMQFRQAFGLLPSEFRHSHRL